MKLMAKSKGNICLGGSQGRPLLMDLGQLLVCRACSLEEELNAEWREQEQAGTYLGTSTSVGHVIES